MASTTAAARPTPRPTKTWAALAADGVTVATIATFDAAMAPGADIDATWTNDVTSVDGIEAGWTLSSGGAWSPPAPAPTQASLVAYAYAKQAALEAAGITVNIGSASTPDVLNVATDDRGKSLVTGAVQSVGIAQQLGKPVPASFQWVNDPTEDGRPGALITLTVAQVMTIQWAMQTYLQGTFTTLGSVLAEIAAGSIKAAADIDAADWPTTSY